MNNYTLGLDFSRIQTCQVSKKSTILGLIMLILSVSFLPIAIVFYFLFINHEPVEINGVLTYYGDPAYSSTMLGIIISFFSSGIVFFVIFILNMFIKPKPYIILNRDIDDYKQIYYVYDNRKKLEIYLKDDLAVIYNKRYDSVSKEDNPKKVIELLNKYVFWYKFNNQDNLKILHHNNKTIIKIKDDTSRSYYGKKMYRYSYNNNFNIIPNKIVEIVGSTYGGSSNYQSRNTYLFEDINQSNNLNIHPEIKKVLQGLT